MPARVAALRNLAIVYGLVFVRRSGLFTIHIPLDTRRMCSRDLVPR